MNIPEDTLMTPIINVVNVPSLLCLRSHCDSILKENTGQVINATSVLRDFILSRNASTMRRDARPKAMPLVPLV